MRVRCFMKVDVESPVYYRKGFVNVKEEDARVVQKLARSIRLHRRLPATIEGLYATWNIEVKHDR